MTRPLTRWGKWRLRSEDRTLEFEGADPFFDLGSINNASDALTQIFEINKQGWATEKAVKDLLRALDDLLDPENDFRPQDQTS